ncbi:MAG: cytochrome c [Sedimenticola sp.]|nr:cytochrome c [Sedimenticola sp.]
MQKTGYLVWIVVGLLLSGGVSAAEKWLSLPPASLAQWYKPQNERQVWLHTMFSLRREMQAVTEYAEAGNQPLMQKWSERFSRHYLSIAEMVPEWKDELEYEWLDQLQKASREGDSQLAMKALKKMGQGCNACHREFRATVALLHRTPDFSGIKVKRSGSEAPQSYQALMRELSSLVNRIKIASEDKQKALALTSLAQLNQGLEDLGGVCASCHKDDAPKARFLGSLTQNALKELKTGLELEDQKRVGRSLGSAAVYACARCHAVHRSLYDMRAQLEPWESTD